MHSYMRKGHKRRSRTVGLRCVSRSRRTKSIASASNWNNINIEAKQRYKSVSFVRIPRDTPRWALITHLPQQGSPLAIRPTPSCIAYSPWAHGLYAIQDGVGRIANGLPCCGRCVINAHRGVSRGIRTKLTDLYLCFASMLILFQFEADAILLVRLDLETQRRPTVRDLLLWPLRI